MEINTQQINPLHSVTPANSVTKEATDSEKNAKTEDAGQNSTLNLSGEALKRSSSTVRSNSSQIINVEQAQQSVEQFKQDIAENPELIQKMLNGNLTPDVVSRLIS